MKSKNGSEKQVHGQVLAELTLYMEQTADIANLNY